jgi:two-component system response regulator AtoC
VRQLENTIMHLAAFSNGGTIDAEAFQPDTPVPGSSKGAEPGEPGDELSLREQVNAFERSLVTKALAAAGGNQTEAARRLGLSRATLFDKLRKYGFID